MGLVYVSVVMYGFCVCVSSHVWVVYVSVVMYGFCVCVSSHVWFCLCQ